MSVKKTLTRLSCVVALLGVLFSYSFANPLINNAKYSGEEILNGIFFLNGEVANVLPEIKEKLSFYEVMDKQQKKDLSAVQQVVVNTIKQNDPAFFARFKTDIESKKHTRIKKALETASNLIAEIVNEKYPAKRIDIDDKDLMNFSNNPSKEEIERAIKKTARSINRKSGSSNSERGTITNVSIASNVVYIINSIAVIVSMQMVPISHQRASDIANNKLYQEKLVNSIIRYL